MTGLIGVAGLGITLAPLADVPGGGTDAEIAGEADITIGESEADAHDETGRGFSAEEGTAGMIGGGG